MGEDFGGEAILERILGEIALPSTAFRPQSEADGKVTAVSMSVVRAGIGASARRAATAWMRRTTECLIKLNMNISKVYHDAVAKCVKRG